MEVKDITDRIDSVIDVTAGAVVAATNPSAEADRLERKGTPVRQRVRREVRSTVGDAQEAVVEIAGALLPERIVLHSLSLVKARARRVDLLGELAYRGLDVFHGSVKEIARAFDRIERASTPPARPKRSVSRAAKTSATQTKTAAKRTTKRAAGTTRRAARRSTSTARRRTTAARRSA